MALSLVCSVSGKANLGSNVDAGILQLHECMLAVAALAAVVNRWHHFPLLSLGSRHCIADSSFQQKILVEK
jgi:hypothetical protein